MKLLDKITRSAQMRDIVDDKTYNSFVEKSSSGVPQRLKDISVVRPYADSIWPTTYWPTNHNTGSIDIIDAYWELKLTVGNSIYLIWTGCKISNCKCSSYESWHPRLRNCGQNLVEICGIYYPYYN